jgi:hypothetical protein
VSQSYQIVRFAFSGDFCRTRAAVRSCFCNFVNVASSPIDHPMTTSLRRAILQELFPVVQTDNGEEDNGHHSKVFDHETPPYRNENSPSPKGDDTDSESSRMEEGNGDLLLNEKKLCSICLELLGTTAASRLVLSLFLS